MLKFIVYDVTGFTRLVYIYIYLSFLITTFPLFSKLFPSVTVCSTCCAATLFRCVSECVNPHEQETSFIALVTQHKENPSPQNRFPKYVQIVNDLFTMLTCKAVRSLQVDIVNTSFTICTY